MQREQLGKVELHGPHFILSRETLNLWKVGIEMLYKSGETSWKTH